MFVTSLLRTGMLGVLSLIAGLILIAGIGWVYQLSVNWRLRNEIEALKKELTALKERRQLLEAEVMQAKTAESILRRINLIGLRLVEPGLEQVICIPEPRQNVLTSPGNSQEVTLR